MLPIAASSQTVARVPLILPSAIVFDPQGNLYLAETANHVIRKVDTSGTLTTIAGTGTQGFGGDNGPATAAQLDSPQGLALDANQNLYIADTHNNRIRRLSLSTGVLTTVAGSTAGFGGDNGLATTAHLNLPTALAVDASQNLYIADTSNHRIRRIDLTTGIITTIAGNGVQGFSGDAGPALAATIDSPQGIAVDPNQNLYLADTHNHRIRKITATTGLITTLIGTGVPGPLALPHGISLDASGNVYISDTANQRIRRIDAITGIITTVAGNGIQTFAGDSGSAQAASLDSPAATTLSPAGLLTLSDTHNNRVRQIFADNTIHTLIDLGSSPSGSTPPSNPSPTDFTLVATGTTTQSIFSGASAVYTFSVQTQGDLNSQISLAASGLPPNATATFNPTNLPPGQSLTTFTLTLTTLKTVNTSSNLTIIAIVFVPLLWMRRRRGMYLVAILLLIMGGITGCGDRVNSSSSQGSTPSKTYTITVTGTATSSTGSALTHTATVNLTVQ